MKLKNSFCYFVIFGVLICNAFVSANDTALLEISVIDASSGETVPARLRIRDHAGKDYIPTGRLEVPIANDRWFVTDGFEKNTFSPGTVTLRAERGLEYRPVKQKIAIASGQIKKHQIKLQRWIDMRKRGYVSSENHVHLGIEQAAAMAAAEDLDFATLLSWWHSPKIQFPQDSQWVQKIKFAGITVPTAVFCGEKEDSWGAVYATGLRSPVEFKGGPVRSNLEFIKSARRKNGLICYQGGWSREVLIDALAGLVDVVNVCNNNFHRHKFQPRRQYSNLLEVDGFPEYPETPEGMMQMNTDTYYRLLNCGLKLAAGAGSAIGAKSTPIGYNRAYVRAGKNPDMTQFLQAWSKGRNFVTNGPMIFLSTGKGHRPGDSIDLLSCGDKITFNVEAVSEQPLCSLEIIANGGVVASAKLDTNQKNVKISHTLDIKQGAWVAARCTEQDLFLSDDELEKYRQGSGFYRREPCRLRFAHTSPIYVTVKGRGARVDKSIKEANKMLEAFRKFARKEASQEYLKEILDAIPERIE